jgi:hypothetical protein
MKLKVIQSRQNEVEVNNDLRGLGKTSLFSDLTPEPVLTVEGSWLSHEPLARDLKISVYAKLDHTGSSDVHLYCDNQHLSHKEKSLQLFMFGVVLRIQNKLNCLLWQRNRFRNELQACIDPAKKHEEHVPRIEGNGFTVSPAQQYFMKQAGFNIQPSEYNQTIADSDASRMLTEIMHSQTTNKHTKFSKVV